MILYVVCRSVIGFRFPALNILELSSLSAKMFQRCRCYTGLHSVQVSVFPGPDFVIHDLHITQLFIRWGFCIFCEQVVFAGFSAEALSQRILDCKPNFVLTTSGVRRGSKVIKLKEIVDDALERVLKEGFAVGNCHPPFQYTMHLPIRKKCLPRSTYIYSVPEYDLLLSRHNH
jgi:hypothetical protein